MASRPAPALMLREGDRVELERLTRSSGVRAGLAQRARIVLLAADGASNTALAAQVGVSRHRWFCTTRTARAGPAAAVRAGADIVHPLTDEPWGVRRFFMRDPDGHVINSEPCLRLPGRRHRENPRIRLESGEGRS